MVSWLRSLWAMVTKKPEFFTCYDSGGRTVLMDYDSCKTYADIFGGKVFHLSKEE